MHVHTAEYRRELRKRRKELNLPFGAQRLLALLEGVEGGFAIGAGTVAGLSLVTSNRRIVLATATISLIVSGFNSAAVKYSSEHYSDQLDGHEKRDKMKHYFIPALYEFLAYSTVSVAILIPVYFLPHVRWAAVWIVFSTLVLLFSAGYWRAYVMHRHRRVHDGLELTLLGIAIVLIGMLSGWFLHHI